MNHSQRHNILGWFSPALPILTDTDKTPLENGPISNDQIGWIGSISRFLHSFIRIKYQNRRWKIKIVSNFSVGSVCGTFLFGFISLKMGAKASMAIMAFPNLIFWILIRFGSSYYHILIARFVNGIILILKCISVILETYYTYSITLSFHCSNMLLYSSLLNASILYRFIAGLTGGSYQTGTVLFISEISNNK